MLTSVWMAVGRGLELSGRLHVRAHLPGASGPEAECGLDPKASEYAKAVADNGRSYAS